MSSEENNVKSNNFLKDYSYLSDGQVKTSFSIAIKSFFDRLYQTFDSENNGIVDENEYAVTIYILKNHSTICEKIDLTDFFTKSILIIFDKNGQNKNFDKITKILGKIERSNRWKLLQKFTKRLFFTKNGVFGILDKVILRIFDIEEKLNDEEDLKEMSNLLLFTLQNVNSLPDKEYSQATNFLAKFLSNSKNNFSIPKNVINKFRKTKNYHNRQNFMNSETELKLLQSEMKVDLKMALESGSGLNNFHVKNLFDKTVLKCLKMADKQSSSKIELTCLAVDQFVDIYNNFECCDNENDFGNNENVIFEAFAKILKFDEFSLTEKTFVKILNSKLSDKFFDKLIKIGNFNAMLQIGSIAKVDLKFNNLEDRIIDFFVDKLNFNENTKFYFEDFANWIIKDKNLFDKSVKSILDDILNFQITENNFTDLNTPQNLKKIILRFSQILIILKKIDEKNSNLIKTKNVVEKSIDLASICSKSAEKNCEKEETKNFLVHINRFLRKIFCHFYKEKFKILAEKTIIDLGEQSFQSLRFALFETDSRLQTEILKMVKIMISFPEIVKTKIFQNEMFLDTVFLAIKTSTILNTKYFDKKENLFDENLSENKENIPESAFEEDEKCKIFKNLLKIEKYKKSNFCLQNWTELIVQFKVLKSDSPKIVLEILDALIRQLF
ncbi:hypothetical protein MHBO_001095, partial [Bonamia ostreae]